MTDEVESEVRVEPEWREPSVLMATGLLEKPKQCQADAFYETKPWNCLTCHWMKSELYQSKVSLGLHHTQPMYNTFFKTKCWQISLTALITSRIGTVAWVLLTSLSGRALVLPPARSPKSRQPVFPTSTYLLKYKDLVFLFFAHFKWPIHTAPIHIASQTFKFWFSMFNQRKQGPTYGNRLRQG